MIRLLSYILFLNFLLTVHSYSQLPPAPVPFPALVVIERAAEVEASAASNVLELIEETYRADIRPTARLILSDGYIIQAHVDYIAWHVENRFYRVEWTADLMAPAWELVGFRTGSKLTHNNPTGFYRVLAIKKPTPPPTHPPKRQPRPPATLATSQGHPAGNGGFK